MRDDEWLNVVRLVVRASAELPIVVISTAGLALPTGTGPTRAARSRTALATSLAGQMLERERQGVRS